MADWILIFYGNCVCRFTNDNKGYTIALSDCQSCQQPLLSNGEQISGSGQTVIVKVTPDTLTQLRDVLHKLDQPPVTFQVSIYQGDPDWLNQQNSDTIVITTPSHSDQLQRQSVSVMNGESAAPKTRLQKLYFVSDHLYYLDITSL